MHDALQKEIATYEKRTPKSAAAHKRALQRIPLGVASNYRHYEPYPIFVKDGKGCRTSRNGSLPKKFANAIRWIWCGSVPAERKSRCTPAASRAPRRATTRF